MFIDDRAEALMSCCGNNHKMEAAGPPMEDEAKVNFSKLKNVHSKSGELVVEYSKGLMLP